MERRVNFFFEGKMMTQHCVGNNRLGLLKKGRSELPLIDTKIEMFVPCEYFFSGY